MFPTQTNLLLVLFRSRSACVWLQPLGCSGSTRCRAPGHLLKEGLVEDVSATCESCASNILIHVDTGAERTAGGAAFEHLLSFYPCLIFLNKEATSKTKTKNFFKEKSGKDRRKMGGFSASLPKPNNNQILQCLLYIQSKTNKKAGKEGFH